tara:strand:- start:155 stop:937 length:783 start_codon:yes stop_codon:yes gene_type:complete
MNIEKTICVWVGRSKNKKTDDVPTGYVGRTLEESLQSCKDAACSLLHKKHGGPGVAIETQDPNAWMARADDLVRDGWRVAAQVCQDFVERVGARTKTPDGNPVLVCPAILTEDHAPRKRVTCNSCRLCDASKPGPIIVFPDHGPSARGAKGARIPLCYAWHGTPRMAATGVWRAAQRNPQRYTLRHAIDNSVRSARMVRLSAIGDPNAVSQAEADYIVDTCEREGMDLVGYCHNPERSSQWKGRLMASIDLAGIAMDGLL